MRYACSLVLLSLMLMVTSEVSADSQCSASNGDGDQTCSISCGTGIEAHCVDAAGGGTPTCECPDHGDTNALAIKTTTKTSHVDHLPTPAPIQNTNLVAVINSKLALIPPKHVDDSCHFEQDHSKCHIVNVGPSHGGDAPPKVMCEMKKVCIPVMGHLRVSAPLLVVKEPVVKLSEPDWTNVPLEISVAKTDYDNCSAVSQSKTYTHEVDSTVGTSVTKTKSVETGNTQSIKVAAHYSTGSNISGVKTDFGVSGEQSFSFSTKITITDSDREDFTHLDKKTWSDPLQIPANSDVTFTDTVIQYLLPVPYTGTITVDGQISANKEHLKLLSDVLPTEADRTFDFAGVVVNGDSFYEATDVQQGACKSHL